MAVLFTVLTVVLCLFLWQQQRESKLLKEKLLSLQETQEVLITKAVLKSQEEERQRFARDWHDNMGNILSTARLLTDTIQTATPAPLLQVQQLLENAHEVAKGVCFNTQTNLFLSQQDLTTYCRTVQDQLQSGGVLFEYRIQENFYETLDQEQKGHLSNILKELITNVLKHANATIVQLDIRKTSQYNQVQFIDNGRGFKGNQPMLPKTIKNRIDRMNGTLQVKNNSPSGSIITIIF